MKSHRLALLLALALPFPSSAAELPQCDRVALQPLAAQARRIADALDLLGAPLSAADRKSLADAAKDRDEARGIATIQAVLDRRCLAGVRITRTPKAEAPYALKAMAGPAAPQLAEQGWRVFLVKVLNDAGVEDRELRAESPNALNLMRRSSGKPDPKVVSLGEVRKRFLDLAMFRTQPLVPSLSGLELEYRILQVHCRDAGRKEATLSLGLFRADDRKGPAIASSNALSYLFESAPAVRVRLHVRDFDGKSSRDGRPIIAAFTFTDAQGRVYPAPTRRLAPDFYFHRQIYRADGESLALQPGRYTVTCTRGPEYLVTTRTITVPAAATHEEAFELKRWIHPAAQGWYSGDHHIHAAGCSHYESPTEGVTPEDMMRHVLGEDLNVGCCLSWGPCWYHQKRYFEGKVNALSTPNHLLRYDVEVSGFPSSHCGHICLLRLKQQDYPGTRVIEDWPSWDLPIFRWAKKQGAVVGFAHSGWGLDVGATRELPNFIVPPMTGIGANEYIVDVTQQVEGPNGKQVPAVDFISTVDTPSVWELNIWYHTLNCGYRCRISGETDFPCIYGERVGLGRSYVKLTDKGRPAGAGPAPLRFGEWVEGVRRGRCYVSDGKSHLIDFRVNNREVGTQDSEVRLAAPATVTVKAKVAALLEPKPTEGTKAIQKAKLNVKPYWDVERSRINGSRKVPVEVIVNGKVVDRKEVVADGREQEVEFAVPINVSSWVCLRILPSSHTNPIFVLVDGKPIRASKKSAEWCAKAVEKCWKEKKKAIRLREREEAEKAFAEAQRIYRKIAAECVAD